ncbi:8893_t:CDS:2 [Funneliformis geosporum]|uniref:945_t:CDS:1 n=1 Tax=Funneliformis geosporum TaxID=1117311 RepID=A0A9W4WPE7_9GLOM|nr:8893_t:CDS:2 [Funneliformis geosporum]CAI2177114.1 945_t:CDS:2 [Funneliformis geosporum]
MAPILYMPPENSTSNKINKNSAINNVNFNSNNKSIKFSRRQEAENNKNTNKKTSSSTATRITSIEDIDFTLVSFLPIPTGSFIPTITALLPTDTTLLPTNTELSPTNTASLPDVSPTDTSIPIFNEPPYEPFSSDTTIQTQPTSTTTSAPGINTNTKRPWLIPIITISLFIILLILIFLGFFIRRKRKRNANNANNYNDYNLSNVNTSVNDDEKVTGNMLSIDKEKENNSKSNSLTSITSISSSFRMKKGKIVPADLNIAIPTALSSPPIVANNNNDEKDSPPLRSTVKRSATIISAFTEIVDLTEEENNNLRKSVSSGIYTITSRISNISNISSGNFGSGERSSVNTVIPLQQERIESMILSPKANISASAIGNGSVNNNNNSRIITFAIPPSDTSSSDDNDTRHSI